MAEFRIAETHVNTTTGETTHEPLPRYELVLDVGDLDDEALALLADAITGDIEALVQNPKEPDERVEAIKAKILAMGIKLRGLLFARVYVAPSFAEAGFEETFDEDGNVNPSATAPTSGTVQ